MSARFTADSGLWKLETLIAAAGNLPTPRTPEAMAQRYIFTTSLLDVARVVIVRELVALDWLYNDRIQQSSSNLEEV